MTDLTTITTPFGLLDEATQKALKEHGGPYEIFSIDGEWAATDSAWYLSATYRVRPEPTRPLVVRDWSVFADWVRFVARDSDGGVWSYSKMPGQSCVEWTKNGCCNRLTALSPTIIIDPGTCDWREAIAERPDEGEVETFTSKAFCVNHRTLPAIYHTEVGNSHPGDFTLRTRNGKPIRAVWEADQ